MVGETRPLAEGEVNEIVDSGKLVRDEVDTPETATWLADYPPVVLPLPHGLQTHPVSL